MTRQATIDLASSVSEVWPLITDTDRGNRLIGNQPVTFSPIPREDAATTSARFVAHTSAGGFDLVYEEAPFEWVWNKTFSVLRTMRSGPLRSYAYKVTLDEGAGGGAHLTFELELVPRHWILKPIAAIQAGQYLERLCELARAIDLHLRERAPSPFEKPAGMSDADRLEQGIRALRDGGLDDAVVARIGEHLRSGADSDLVRMRPFSLAAEWGLDRLEVLKACLQGVPVGLLELRWSLVCPSCQTASQEVKELDEISVSGHCQLCDISFELDLDRAVEATFVVHPSVRVVPSQFFCIGGPARTPHVLAQVNVPAMGTRGLGAPSEEARLRVFVRGGRFASCTVEQGAPDVAELVLTEDALGPPEVRVAPGGEVRLASRIDEPVHAKLERLGYASEAATAHVVATVPEFRRLFSGDILKRGTPLKVSHVAILFTDLTGSTALYANAGDAAAFRLVDDHFDVLRKAIDASGGTVVKTMGDAVMAAFTDTRACLGAAERCLEDFERFQRQHLYGAQTGLKLGFFSGPCYVVSANGVLDYFGQTVNVASRLQHLAESGEIIVEKRQFEGIDMPARMTVRETFDTRVKGVPNPIEVLRLAFRTAVPGPHP